MKLSSVDFGALIFPVPVSPSFISVKMQAHPISDFKAIERVDEHVADFFQTDFNIGVDALCYRNGKDYIGFHADDTQGEDIVVSLTVESLCQRVLRIKPKGKVCVGDEQIDLFPCAGDGYSMDGNMQCGYLHSLRKAGSGKKVAEARRFALIFRHGEVASVGKDTGKQVESLEPDPSGPVEYSFGAMECVQQGQEYTKSDLVASGAHKYVAFAMYTSCTFSTYSIPPSPSLILSSQTKELFGWSKWKPDCRLRRHYRL
jgi:hypothetical protein